jgi:integrase
VLQPLEATFKSAIVRGHRERASPCVGVTQELGTGHRKVVNHRALPYGQVPAFLEQLRASDSWMATRLAFEWLVLTATRSGETRMATWGEVDEQLATWTIPAERMKAKRAHAVPLSPQCLEILAMLRNTFPSEPSDPLFPSSIGGKPLSDMRLTKVLRDLGLAEKATVHGMRSAFKVWCAEVARARDEVSEAALAHAIPEKVRAAYLRTQFLDERRPLMAAWARFCSEPHVGAA